MPDPIPTPEDFCRAELVCDYLTKNLEIQFQIDGPQMPRDQAVKHFGQRQALRIVQTMLLDAGERALDALGDTPSETLPPA